MTLAEFQAGFWRALWAEPGDAGPGFGVATQAGFSVYRNTVQKGCVDALLSLYPAVHRLTGDAWMQAAALDFARAHPPTSGALQHYGAGFAAFLDEALAGGELRWLGEVARLDRLWNDSHVAADAPVLGLAAFARLEAERLGACRLRPHPAACWRWSPNWPAFSLWQAARSQAADPNPPHWRGQGALLTRPAGAVTALEISAADCALLDACASGEPLNAALHAALARAPDVDPGAGLARLVQHGAFAAIMELPS